MKKNIMVVIALCLTVFLAFSVSSVSPVEPDREASLTLVYRYNDAGCESLLIKTFRVASILPDGTLELTGPFADYPITVNGVTSQAEWREIADTLETYILKDEIMPTFTQSTDAEGNVCFRDIAPGMYLTLTVTTEKENKIVCFETFLTVLPGVDVTGEHDYDVTAVPKYSAHEKEQKEIERKVIKLWKDSGHENLRPDSVVVDIFKNGVLEHTQTLSEENAWTYSWSCPDDGSVWHAAERETPKNYTMTVTENGNTIFITNVHIGDEPPAPQTGDTFVLWHYLLPMFLSGGGILILSVYRRRSV